MAPSPANLTPSPSAPHRRTDWLWQQLSKDEGWEASHHVTACVRVEDGLALGLGIGVKRWAR